MSRTFVPNELDSVLGIRNNKLATVYLTFCRREVDKCLGRYLVSNELACVKDTCFQRV